MGKARHARVLFAWWLTIVGCTGEAATDDDPPPDRCAMLRECFPADAVGCCGTTPTRVSVCDACPASMVERRSCRTTGCVDPCGASGASRDANEAPDPAPGAGAAAPFQPPQPPPVQVTCLEDLGRGCCGARVFNADMCGRCPAGSRPRSECTTPAAQCACGSTSDGGVGSMGSAGPYSPGGQPQAQPAPMQCFQYLSAGCCGEYVGSATMCGECPAGSVPAANCARYASGGPDAPTIDCRIDYGGGCCGAVVPTDACGGSCLPGSIAATACTDYREGGAAPTPAGGADSRAPSGGAGFAEPPAPTVECRRDLGGGCCGETVPIRACSGACPEGAIFTAQCTRFSPSCG